MADGNVAEIMGALTNAGDKSDQAVRNITGLLKKQHDLEMQAASDYELAAADELLVTQKAGEALLAGQIATGIDKRKLTLDTPEQVSLRTQSIDEFITRKREADARLEEIKQKASVGFLDNPMEYISNQLELPTLVQQYNMTGMQANSALRTVRDIDTTLTAAANQNKATAETLDDAAVAATARLAANKYNMLAIDKEYKALGSNIQANQIIDHGNKQQIEYLLKQYEVLKSEENLKMHREQMAAQRRRDEVFFSEHADKAAAKQYLRENLVLGMAALSMPKPNEGVLLQYEEAYKTPEGRAQMQKILDAGVRMRFTGLAIYGDSPADSYYTLAKVGDRTKGTEQELVAKVIGAEANKLINAQVDPRKPDVFKPALDAAMAKVMKAANANPETGGSLIYKAPPVERMAQNEYVANTPWYQTVLAPSVAAAKAANATVPDIPATKIFEMTTQMVRDKQLTLEQAVDGIATYYKAAGAINTVKNGKLGIAPQQGYNVDVGSSMFGGGNYDFSKPEQVVNALLNKLSMDNPQWGYVGEMAARLTNPLYRPVKQIETAEEYGALPKKPGDK